MAYLFVWWKTSNGLLQFGYAHFVPYLFSMILLICMGMCLLEDLGRSWIAVDPLDAMDPLDAVNLLDAVDLLDSVDPLDSVDTLVDFRFFSIFGLFGKFM